jgi:hypothetical protein
MDFGWSRHLRWLSRAGIQKRDQHTRRDSIGVKFQQISGADVRARRALNVGHDHAFIHLGI